MVIYTVHGKKKKKAVTLPKKAKDAKNRGNGNVGKNGRVETGLKEDPNDPNKKVALDKKEMATKRGDKYKSKEADWDNTPPGERDEPDKGRDPKDAKSDDEKIDEQDAKKQSYMQKMKDRDSEGIMDDYNKNQNKKNMDHMNKITEDAMKAGIEMQDAMGKID